MAYKVIFKSLYGSHLYGTSTPDSDMDYKQIHMNATDIMLTGKDSGGFNQNTNAKGRNTKDDVDFESKELRTFIKDCLGGQTYAADLLYTPESLYFEKTAMWDEIISLRDKLVTRNVMPYIGYVRSQASKYSMKGEKYNELQDVLQQLNSLSIKFNIRDSLQHLKIEGLQHFKTYEKELHHGSKELYFVGPDCEFPASRGLSEVIPVLKAKLEAFGLRAKAAADNKGLDLKAYYHALRIVWQLEEYLTTARVKFPSDRVQDLRDVRAGKYNQTYIENWISDEIERVLQIPNELPEPDYKFWDAWLLDKYMLQAQDQSLEYLTLRGLR